MADTVGVNFRITADASGAIAAMNNIRSSVSNFGSQLQSVGARMTAAITLPIVGIGTAAVHSALQLDTFRNRLVAIEGSVDAANARIARLQSLAQTSVGVTTKAALDAFSQLSSIGGITEQTIERQIKALGRLNAAFTIDDPAQFNRNLVQIFSQGFERADIKEAIGRVPIFEQLLESAFGTQDGAKLKALKEAGELTLDGFLAGLAGAVETNPKLALLGESISVKLQKTFERAQFALAPLGAAILKVIEPFIEPAVRLLERLSVAFAELPDSTKLGVIAFGAVAAAAGPLVAILGTLIVAISSVGAPFAAAALVVTAAVAGMAAAYTTNFLGIRDITDSVLKEVVGFVQEHIGVIVAFWNDNLPLIQQTVETVMNAVRVFWEKNGEDITRIVKAVWEIIKTVISTTTQVILNVIKLAMQIINEDWGGAWETFQKICQVALDGIGRIMSNLGSLLVSAVKAAITALLILGAEIQQRMLSVGAAIVAGIIAGVISKEAELMKVMRNLALRAVVAASTALVIRSPSQKFFEIGESIVDGLINGLQAGQQRVNDMIETLVAGPTATFATDTGRAIGSSISGHFRGRIGRPPSGPRVSDEDNAAIDAPVPDFSAHINAIDVFKESATNAWGSIASGFGSMLESFLAGEKVAGVTFAKMAKAAIASVAAEAAVRALFHLAMGIAYTFFNPPLAANQFAAAKAFGAVAAVASVAALAIPGGSSGGGNSPGGFASGLGTSRDSDRDRTRREGRPGGAPDPNQPVVYVYLNAKDAPGTTIEHVRSEYRRGGALRDLFRQDLLGEATG